MASLFSSYYCCTFRTVESFFSKSIASPNPLGREFWRRVLCFGRDDRTADHQSQYTSRNYAAGVIPTNSTDSPTYYHWAYNNNVKSIVFTSGTTYTTQANADYLFANMLSLTSISTNNSLNMVSRHMLTTCLMATLHLLQRKPLKPVAPHRLVPQEQHRQRQRRRLG